jgi:SAM-dependent methyltransferase
MTNFDNFQSIRRTIRQQIADAVGLTPEVIDIVENTDNPGARSYMIDIIPYIHKLYPKPLSKVLRVLDVGCKTGAGSALLADIHRLSAGCSSLIMEVTALDLVPWFAKYAALQYPYLNYIVQDIFTLKEIYDLIVCSHTIEHVPEVEQFITRMREISFDYVITYCPFNEHNLIDEHIHRFDSDLINKLKPDEFYIKTNIGWKPRGDCLVMIFKGIAHNRDADLI